MPFFFYFFIPLDLYDVRKVFIHLYIHHVIREYFLCHTVVKNERIACWQPFKIQVYNLSIIFHLICQVFWMFFAACCHFFIHVKSSFTQCKDTGYHTEQEQEIGSAPSTVSLHRQAVATIQRKEGLRAR